MNNSSRNANSVYAANALLDIAHKIVLQRHLYPYGKESLDVLKYAYLNSFYQTGLKNLLDVAVFDRKQELASLNIDREYHKFDEIPFDFVRRRMSVIIAETGKDHVLICKGAVEEVLKICTQLKVDDKILPIDESVYTKVADLQQKLNSDGLRVIAVAYKTIPLEQSHCAIADESNLILLGNIAFLDPPKDSAADYCNCDVYRNVSAIFAVGNASRNENRI